MNIIRWCNENNGFLTAILSLIGLVLSVTAIVVINEQRVTITDYAKTAVQLLTYLTNHIKPKSAVFPYIVIMRLKLIGGSE